MNANDRLRRLETTLMPCGQYKGLLLDQVPLPYLARLVRRLGRRPPQERPRCFARLRAYLNHPTIQRELRIELTVLREERLNDLPGF